MKTPSFCLSFRAVGVRSLAKMNTYVDLLITNQTGERDLVSVKRNRDGPEDRRVPVNQLA